MKISENYSLLSHNTFGLEVSTRIFIEYENEEDIKKLLSDEYFLSQPFFHIGEGSNLLFLDNYDGIIVHSLMKQIDVVKEDADFVFIKVGSGVNWDHFVAFAVENNWGGIENLSLIPGEVGASAVQNIGAYGSEVKDIISEVIAYEVATGKKQIFSQQECNFAYRKSIFKEELKNKYIISEVVFRLNKKTVYNIEYGNLKAVLGNEEINLKNIRQAVISIRESKLPDPKVLGNAGSFFMNPYICKSVYEKLKKNYPEVPSYPVSETLVKLPAAWLIDQCGLKGTSLGNAAVHDKQALVLVNKGGATGNEIALLAEKVKETVKQKFNVDIEPEVTYIG